MPVAFIARLRLQEDFRPVTYIAARRHISTFIGIALHEVDEADKKRLIAR